MPATCGGSIYLTPSCCWFCCCRWAEATGQESRCFLPPFSLEHGVCAPMGCFRPDLEYVIFPVMTYYHLLDTICSKRIKICFRQVAWSCEKQSYVLLRGEPQLSCQWADSHLQNEALMCMSFIATWLNNSIRTLTDGCYESGEKVLFVNGFLRTERLNEGALCLLKANKWVFRESNYRS